MEPSRDVIDRLRSVSRATVGLKLSLYVAADAHPRDVAAVIDRCWAERPIDESPTMLLAVLRHLHSGANELIAFHRGQVRPSLACFALVDGSVHEDAWLEFGLDTPTRLHAGPRFQLSALQPQPRVRPEPTPASELVLR